MKTNNATNNAEGLATLSNIGLLGSFINERNSDARAKEIFGLLDKTPDEIITHFIAEKNFGKARELTKIFFPKIKKDCENRNEYYTLIREAVCNVLREIGSGDRENIGGLTDSMFVELDLLFDEQKHEFLFLGELHRFCIELLEIRSIYADDIVVSMLEYFGERRETDRRIKHPEFILNVPSALMKWKIENTEGAEEEDEPPFPNIIDAAQSMLPEGENLRDNEWLSIFYDEENESVSIKPNKDITYHIAEGENLPREAK
ncbi:MAG: hypothetical protein WC606_02560 [Candidatus Absconditabacterales bacterium]